MSFSLSEFSYGNLKAFRLKNRNTAAYLSIVPSLGSALFELNLTNGIDYYSILEGPSIDDNVEKDYRRKFQGANLLPFPNRINKGKYIFDHRSYELSTNEGQAKHAIHGFVFDKEFSISYFHPALGKLCMEYVYNGSHLGYPFLFKQRIEFKLSDDKLIIIVSIKNLEDRSIPIAHGWHPYFSFHKPIDKLQLKTAGKKYYKVNNAMIPTGETDQLYLFQKLEFISDERMDHCFIVEGAFGESIIFDPESGLKLNISHDGGKEGYAYVQYYTPEDRKSIAIEPMTAMPDAFNQNVESCILLPKAWKRLKTTIKLS